MSERPDVLVVDDDVDVRESLVEVLEERGYHALGAANGAQALDVLRQGARPALILLDMMMPVMDGATFRAEQQRAPELAPIPVVLISASHDLAESARRLRATGTLQKPISFRDLLETVRRLLGGGGRAATPAPA